MLFLNEQIVLIELRPVSPLRHYSQLMVWLFNKAAHISVEAVSSAFALFPELNLSSSCTSVVRLMTEIT